MSSDLLSDFPDAGSSTGGDAFNIAIYTIVSMAILVGITYLLGKAFNIRKLEDWAKSEFLQVFISAALVGGLFFLMAPGTGLIVMAFDQLAPDDIAVSFFDVEQGIREEVITSDGCFGNIPDGSLLCYSSNYLNALFYQVGGLLFKLMIANTVLDIVSKIAIDVVFVEITPLSGAQSIVQVLGTFVQTLVIIEIGLQVIIALLHFIASTALNIFLPVGVVLRSFFLTRRIGGLLIGLAVGLYIVFPMTIAMNAIAVDASITPELVQLGEFFNAVDALNVTNAFTSPGALLDAGTWTNYFSNFGTAVTTFFALIGKIPTLLTSIISLLVVQVFVLPLFSIVLTIIAVKELGAFFGSETNLSRFEV